MSYYLSGLAASGFANEEEGLVVAEGAEELVLVLPHGELLALLEELEVPRRVGPPAPRVDGRRVSRRGGAVDGDAAEPGGEGGERSLVVVGRIAEAHFPLPFCTHCGGGGGGASATAFAGPPVPAAAAGRGRKAGGRNGGVFLKESKKWECQQRMA